MTYPPSSVVLNALAVTGPTTVAALVGVTDLPRDVVENALGLLSAGCYVVREGGLYRRSTRDERAISDAEGASHPSWKRACGEDWFAK